jgi:transketolase
MRALEGMGIHAQLMEMHTIKPLDRQAILQAASETRAIVTIEDHSILGGLGGAVAEVLATQLPTPMRMIGIQDRFARSGDAEALYRYHHMTVEDIVSAALELVEGKGK